MPSAASPPHRDHASRLEALYALELEIASQRRESYEDDLTRRRSAAEEAKRGEADRVREHRQRLAAIRAEAGGGAGAGAVRRRAATAPRRPSGRSDVSSSPAHRAKAPSNAGRHMDPLSEAMRVSRVDSGHEREGRTDARDQWASSAGSDDGEGSGSDAHGYSVRRSPPPRGAAGGGRAPSSGGTNSRSAAERARRVADLHASLRAWSRANRARVDSAVGQQEAVMGDAEVPIFLPPSAAPERRRSTPRNRRGGGSGDEGSDNGANKAADDPLDAYDNVFREYQARVRSRSRSRSGGNARGSPRHGGRHRSFAQTKDRAGEGDSEESDAIDSEEDASRQARTRPANHGAAPHQRPTTSLYASAAARSPLAVGAVDGSPHHGRLQSPNENYVASHGRTPQQTAALISPIGRRPFRSDDDFSIMMRSPPSESDGGDAGGRHRVGGGAGNRRGGRGGTAMSLDVDASLTSRYLWAGGVGERQREGLEPQRAPSQRRHVAAADGDDVANGPFALDAHGTHVLPPGQAPYSTTGSAYGSFEGRAAGLPSSIARDRNSDGDGESGVGAQGRSRSKGRRRFTTSPSAGGNNSSSYGAARREEGRSTAVQSTVAPSNAALRAAVAAVEESIYEAMAAHKGRCARAVGDLLAQYGAQLQQRGAAEAARAMAPKSTTNGESVAGELIRLVSLWGAESARPYNQPSHQSRGDGAQAFRSASSADPAQNAEWHGTLVRLVGYSARASLRLDVAVTAANLPVIEAAARRAEEVSSATVASVIPLCFQLLALRSLSPHM